MPRGGWRYVAALGGIAALGSVGHAQQRQPDPDTQNSANAPPPLAVTIVETPEQTVAAQGRENEERQHERADLDAQVTAADAASRQVWPAWLAAILSFAGTLLIVWTLFLTRQANRTAMKERASNTRRAAAAGEDTKKALAIAKRNADAAAQQVDHVRDDQASRLRAWVTLDTATCDFMMKGGEQKVEIVPIWINLGQTPAFNFRSAVAWAIVAPHELKTLNSDLARLDDDPERFGGFLAPGQTLRSDGFTVDTQQFFERHFLINCRASYFDGFTDTPRSSNIELRAECVLSAAGQHALRWTRQKTDQMT